jgi:hypothetical protein
MRHPQCLLWPLWKRLVPILNAESSRRALARSVFNLFFLRSLLYLDYLDRMEEKPSWVFLTDCRDVIFQDNVFERVASPGLYCFLEGEGRTIASCPSNSRMLRNCYGERAVSEIGHCEPSCAGTVLGDYENVHAYLLETVKRAMALDCMRAVPGDDQGLHNYIVHRQLTANVKLVGNDSGPVGTMGCVAPEEIRFSEKHLVLQKDGRPYAVLHQQDRHDNILSSHPVYKLCS